MKKFIYVVAVMAIIGLASCSNKNQTVEANDSVDTVTVMNDTLTDGVPTEAVDSTTVVEVAE